MSTPQVEQLWFKKVCLQLEKGINDQSYFKF